MHCSAWPGDGDIVDIHYPRRREALYHQAMFPPIPADADARSARWLWLLPRLALLLFVVSVATQLWLRERADSEEDRATLINDALWLEQNLRFNLRHNEERLAAIGTEQAADARQFEAHARTLLANNSGLRQVVWLDAAARPTRALPASDFKPDVETASLAHALGRPTYGDHFRDAAGEWRFSVHVPLSRSGQVVGTVVGIYALDKLLDEGVPWWLAQRNHIGVTDLSGLFLARYSKQAVPDLKEGHRIEFNPPGHGLGLWLSAIRKPAPLSGKFLSVSLVLLALLVLWSLWALRRHFLQRLEAEGALREQHALRQAMEDSLQTGLRARDLKGMITYVNPAFCRMVGWSQDELVGRAPPMPYWIDEEIDSTRALNESILAGEGPKQGFEIRFKRRDGEIFCALVHEAPLVDAGGRQTGWMSSIVDITPQKQADERERQREERLQASARLIAMGEMASSLAHELNQPLAAISSYTTGSINLIEAGRTDLPELRGVLAKIREQSQRAGRIIHRIYAFVRRAEPKSEPCDIGHIIEEMADLIEADARRRQVAVRRHLAADLLVIRGDRVLLGQALLNLMRNGIEAMQGSARDDRVLAIDARAESGHIHIAIADRGPGIAPEVATQLFEPFYTTKEEGMGMGLNICRSIVEAHQGRLILEANPGGGSRFTVSLPLEAA